MLRGVLAAGTRSGSVVPMNGTSVAAPQATRWTAEAWLRTDQGQSPAASASGAQGPEGAAAAPIPPADLASVGNRLAPVTPRWPNASPPD